MYRVLTDIIDLPDFLAGYSLGEYSALCCSGAISFKDTLNIVIARWW
jgi:[acyl-carrier-protein] S-malonyltransferase